MGRGRAASAAHRPDGLAAGYVLPHTYADLRHVAVAGRNAVPMVDHHNVTVTAVHAGEDDSSVGGGLDRGSVVGCDVQAGMVFIPAAEGVTAPAETVGDVPAHGPAARGRGEFDLVPVENVLDISQFALQRGCRLFDVAQICFATRASATDVIADVGGSAYT